MPLKHDYRTPRDRRLATYPLDDSFSVPSRKRRRVKPRQLVVASLVGDVEPGHTYLVVVPAALCDDPGAYAGVSMALARFGGRFSPAVDFYIFAEGTLIAEMTGLSARGAVFPCSDEARRPEVVAHSPIVQRQKRRLRPDDDEEEA